MTTDNRLRFRFTLRRTIAIAFMGIAVPLVADAQTALYPDLFDLDEVELTDSRFSRARDLNIKVLLEYDTDRLLYPYMKAAGLPTDAKQFPNWDGLDGHVGGHYLSALAIHYAATGNKEIGDRMRYVIDVLKKCQDANGNGYVGGVPDGKTFFKRIKEGDVKAVWDYWVPWYNVHKTYAGLRDAWLYAGDKQAKEMFLKFCDWGIDEISGLSDRQMESMLDNEFGGMNEVFADAFQMTGDKKYLEAAKRFSHHWLLDSMAAGVDNLDNKHANTQVPKVVGYSRVALLDPSDAQYRDAASFFWETVTGTRSLSFGGNSRREHFAPAGDCRSYIDDREGPETCNTNNMLKLTESLFRGNPDSRYADFYERALFNHILSSQHPEHGGYVYFTPARPAHYRVYSAPNEAMWCCVGTGMENHGKYNEFIYTHSGDSLRVNLFIPSVLRRKDNGMEITQTTNFPVEEKTTITIGGKAGKSFPLMIRRPEWCKDFSIKVNGKDIDYTLTKGYATILRKWKKGDKIEVSLPMSFSFEEVPNVPEYVSILRGPIVMGAKFATDDIGNYVADDTRWAHIAHGKLISVFDTPILIGDRDEIISKLNSLRPVEDGMRYNVSGIFNDPGKEVTLEPFNGIHDTRYMLYWLSMTPEKYVAWKENARAEEEQRLSLDRRTVDAIKFGEQQPEADHYMQSKNSRTGNFNGESWRDASSGGHITAIMNGYGNEDLCLRVQYYGNEQGNKGVEIYINDVLLKKEDVSNLGGMDAFVDKEYSLAGISIPEDGKLNIRIQPASGASTGGIYSLRLVKPQE